MSAEAIKWIVGVALVPLLGVAIPQIITRLNKREDSDSARISSLLAQVTTMQERMNEQDRKIDGLQRTMGALISRDALWRIHADRQDAEMTKAGLTPLDRHPSLAVEAVSFYD